MKFTSTVLLIFIVTISIFSGSAFAAADLTLDNRIYDSTTPYGAENYQYVTVTNNGPDTANNVKVNVTRSFNTIEWWVSYDNQNTYIKNDTSFNPTTGVWTVGNMAAGKKLYLDIRMLINRTGSVTNTANATANNANLVSKAFTINVPASPTPNIDLQLTNSFNYTNPSPGSENTFKITITKPWLSSTATDLIVNDGMPAEIDITSWKVGTKNWLGTWTYVDDDPTYNSWTGIWNIASLSGTLFGTNDKQLEIKFITPLTGGARQVISTVYGAENDLTLGNNYAAAYFTVPASLMISAAPQSAPVTAAGQDLTSTRTISNTESGFNVQSETGPNTPSDSGLHKFVNINNLKVFFSKIGLHDTPTALALSNLLQNLMGVINLLSDLTGMLLQIIST